MRKYQIKGTVYVYDKILGKMVLKKDPKPIEGSPASGDNDEAKRGESLESSHGPWHTWKELRAIAEKIYPKTVDEVQKALLELSADNKEGHKAPSIVDQVFKDNPS